MVQPPKERVRRPLRAVLLGLEWCAMVRGDRITRDALQNKFLEVPKGSGCDCKRAALLLLLRCCLGN